MVTFLAKAFVFGVFLPVVMMAFIARWLDS